MTGVVVLQLGRC